MESNRKITVTSWVDVSIPIAESHRPNPYRWSSGVIGLIGTLLLHALALESALSGMGAHRSLSPEVQVPGSTLHKSDVGPSETLVLIQLPATSSAHSGFSKEANSVSASLREIPIAIIRPDPPAMRDIKALEVDAEQEHDSEMSVDSGNGAELARLFGIYSGQIQARVERLWRRPRTPINEGGQVLKTETAVEYFRCEVQIIQDAAGTVQEVLLPSCNGSFAWQRSLVTAIQQSTPLPAPPDPKVFSRAVTLEFVGYAYGEGRSDEQYELQPNNFVQANSPVNSSNPSAHEKIH